MADSSDDFATLLRDFSGQLERVWRLYEASGPGNVSSALLDPIVQQAPQLSTLLDSPSPDRSIPDDIDRTVLGAAINQATDLARRCVTLPQGLCFVSGEAGLVPRRDQIDAFAAARASILAAAGGASESCG